MGLRFRKQHPVADYIADFYCHRLKLVIEIDEEHHGRPQQSLHDEIRTEVLNRYGIQVIRFKEIQVLENMDHIISELTKICQELTRRITSSRNNLNSEIISNP